MDPKTTQNQGAEPFEYPQDSNRRYYTLIILLLVVVAVIGIALMAVSNFSKALNNTLKTSVSIKQTTYENPFITTQAQAYENPFSITPTPQSYQNPFSQ